MQNSRFPDLVVNWGQTYSTYGGVWRDYGKFLFFTASKVHWVHESQEKKKTIVGSCNNSWAEELGSALERAQQY
jgi:hypothetical protein